jgi:hypothetical protein
MSESWLQALAIGAAMLGSEDLTCLTVGLLISDGSVPAPIGVASCAAGLSRLGPRRHRVPAVGEPVRLAIAGNHAQGTLFLDGSDLITAALERRVDDIARAVRVSTSAGSTSGTRASSASCEATTSPSSS